MGKGKLSVQYVQSPISQHRKSYCWDEALRSARAGVGYGDCRGHAKMTRSFPISTTGDRCKQKRITFHNIWYETHPCSVLGVVCMEVCGFFIAVLDTAVSWGYLFLVMWSFLWLILRLVRFLLLPPILEIFVHQKKTPSYMCYSSWLTGQAESVIRNA